MSLFSKSFDLVVVTAMSARKHLKQGSPIPGSHTGTSPRPVRNQATQQEVSGG